MKYAQLISGLLIGTALGGSVVAASGTGGPAGTLDKESIKEIVRETIREEPKLIIESVQNLQKQEQQARAEDASKVLEDKALVEAIFNNKNAPVAGKADSEKVVAEFFDYNCPACKMMFKSLDELLAKDKEARVVFHEYPIFGPQSETNSKIGLAVNRLYPAKYLDFHRMMMSNEGRTDEKTALGYVAKLGMDADKVKAEAASKEVAAILEENRKLGEKLQVQGTPTLVLKDEVVPHALDFSGLEAKLNK